MHQLSPTTWNDGPICFKLQHSFIYFPHHRIDSKVVNITFQLLGEFLHYDFLSHLSSFASPLPSNCVQRWVCKCKATNKTAWARKCSLESPEADWIVDTFDGSRREAIKPLCVPQTNLNQKKRHISDLTLWSAKADITWEKSGVLALLWGTVAPPIMWPSTISTTARFLYLESR